MDSPSCPFKDCYSFSIYGLFMKKKHLFKYYITVTTVTALNQLLIYTKSHLGFGRNYIDTLNHKLLLILAFDTCGVPQASSLD